MPAAWCGSTPCSAHRAPMASPPDRQPRATDQPDQGKRREEPEDLGTLHRLGKTPWTTTTRPTSAPRWSASTPATGASRLVVPQRRRHLGLDKLVDVDDQKALSTGVRASEYYLCSKETGKSCVIDPAPYKVGDKIVMLASFIEPIMLNGGVPGHRRRRLSVNFIQEMLLGANQKLYSGAGEMALIGGNGRIVAYTKDPSELARKSAISSTPSRSPTWPISSAAKSPTPSTRPGPVELSCCSASAAARAGPVLQLPLRVMADRNQAAWMRSVNRTFGMAWSAWCAGVGLLGLAGGPRLAVRKRWWPADDIARRRRPARRLPAPRR